MSCNATDCAMQASFAYQMYVHLEELRRPQRHALRLNKSKVQLTARLLSETVDHIQTCSIDDLDAINRQLEFKEKLRREIDWMRRHSKRTTKRSNDQTHLMSTTL